MSQLDQKLNQAKQSALPRTVHIFDIPDAIPGDVRQVGIKELTAQEELIAVKRAGNDPGRIAYERVKESIVEVNGQPVSLSDGSTDAVWAKLHPMARDLVATGWQEVHMVKEDVAQLFLRSRKVRVG